MKKKLLIVKIDNAGDYIIFRNFIEIIRKSKKYSQFHITVLCNNFLEDLVDFLDRKYLDKIISIDLKKYLFNDWYAQRIKQEITQNTYEVIFHPTYSRIFKIDCLINSIDAKEKISFDSFDEDTLLNNRMESKKYYTKLIPITNEKLFEFDRYKMSVENFLNEKLIISKPNIKLRNDWRNQIFINNFIILYIGAEAEYRRWDTINYYLLSEYILENYDVNIIICGGEKEKNDGMKIKNYLNSNRVFNLVGQTTLIDMLYLINNSKLLISNETNAPHIAIALDRQVIVISNGNHFGRFTPYPKEYTNKYYAIYPFKYNKLNINELLDKYYLKSEQNINQITVKQVQQLISNILTPIINTSKKSYKKIANIYTDNVNNYKFALTYSYLFSQIKYLKDSDDKYVIYGFGSIGKTIDLILKNQIICFVDINSLVISKSINKDIPYSPQNLSNIRYDKIIVSVLGRENEIVDYLVNKLNIEMDKIITFFIK